MAFSIVEIEDNALFIGRRELGDDRREMLVLSRTTKSRMKGHYSKGIINQKC
ncbi:MAG: hypothetical protein K8T10_00930 [Candidatus Eremiobacteraeota bacterium]|nr:hypothetical protein [Candidatus Eremiobacteraeota bacterium]